MSIITIQCGRCGGTGTDNNCVDENGDSVTTPCVSCEETGRLEGFILDDSESMGLIADIVAEQASQREDLTAALTNIIAEQASIREDLTTILSNIWNKVNV